MMLKKYNRIERCLILIGIVTFMIYAVSFEYGDCRSLTAWSYELLDVLFSGKILDFYEYTIENIRGAQHFMCGGVFYPLFFLAAWNLPVWLICIMLQIQNVSSGVFVLWTKIFFILLFILTIYTMNKISYEIQGRQNEWNKYIFLIMFGSAEFVFSMCYAGQDEIIYVFFALRAYYHYIKGNRKKFYIFSVISILYCQIMLIPYLLLVIFEDKQWYSILSKYLITIIPTQIFNIIYADSPRYRFYQSDNFFEWFFGRNIISTGWGGVSVLALILIFIFGYAYFYNSENKTKIEMVRDQLYAVSMAMCAIAFLGWDQFYRSFIWLPFVLLLIVNYHTKNIQFNLSVVVVIGILRTILTCVMQSNIFKVTDLSAMLKKILETHHITVKTEIGIFASVFKNGSMLPLLMVSAMIGGILIFFYFNRKEGVQKLETNISVHMIVMIHFLMPLFLILFFAYKCFC